MPAAPNFNDGVDNLGRNDGQRAATGFNRPAANYAAPAATPQSRALINALTAPVLGVPVDQVPDLVTLLFGPLASGTEVSVQ